ncbi:UNVERIFIED_CONTAM: Transcription factor, partial [Sesamum radiatum]
EKKEKVSERISALQQLVSPYGKGEDPCSLKSKGLCLVPISFNVGVVSSNGADIWAPIKTSHLNSRRSISDEVSVVTHS